MTRFSHESARGLLVSAQLQGTRNRQLTASALNADWLACTPNAFQPGGLAASRSCATRSAKPIAVDVAVLHGPCVAGIRGSGSRRTIGWSLRHTRRPGTANQASLVQHVFLGFARGVLGPTSQTGSSFWLWRRKHDDGTACCLGVKPMQIRKCLTFTLPNTGKPLTTPLHLSAALT